MNESPSSKKIQKFAPMPTWPTQVSASESSDYIYQSFDTSTSPKQLDMAGNVTPAVRGDKTAQETAFLQAKINARRKNTQIQPLSDGSDSVTHTAFLQNQIDLRRKNKQPNK